MSEPNKLAIGMYVRCPVPDMSPNGRNWDPSRYPMARTFYLGKIIDGDPSYKVTVAFHDLSGLYDTIRLLDKINETNNALPLHMKYDVIDIEHIPARVETDAQVKINGEVVSVLILAVEKDADGFFVYTCLRYRGKETRVETYRESELELPIESGDYSPAKQMMHYELQKPIFYRSRRIVSGLAQAMQNVPAGFRNLLGMPIQLFPHQVDAVLQALKEQPCRLMLADEVGLGKTIEALAVLRTLQQRHQVQDTLILVPEALKGQWKTELRLKFTNNVLEEDTTRRKVVSYEELLEKPELRNHPWDMIIVDEVHHIIHIDKLYMYVRTMLNDKQRNVLLLSATPILSKDSKYKREYHHLLTLLRPDNYGTMSQEAFDHLANQQMDLVELVRNIDEDIADEDIDNLKDDLCDLSGALQDEYIATLLSRVETMEEDQIVEEMRHVISYVTQFYQMDNGIVRHRRREILAGQGSQKTRDVMIDEYVPSSQADNAKFGFESDCYACARECARDILADETSGDESLAYTLLSAACSSPYALKGILRKHPDCEPYFVKDNVNCVDKWLRQTEYEISDIPKELDNMDLPSDLQNKFVVLANEIVGNQWADNKILIFTQFEENIEKIQEALKKVHEYDPDLCKKGSAVSFSVNGDRNQEAVSAFQNQKSCRFLVCDESGGEGHNFQMADTIIHFDLPMSIAALEQRLGRLDRIGREAGDLVHSVVLCARRDFEENNDYIEDENLEEKLFDLFNQKDGLNIFEESICGLEIAFEKVYKEIRENIKKTILNPGLASWKEMEKQLNREIHDLKAAIDGDRFYDEIAHGNVQQAIANRIEPFTQYDGKMMREAIYAWLGQCHIGLKPDKHNPDICTIMTKGTQDQIGGDSRARCNAGLSIDLTFLGKMLQNSRHARSSKNNYGLKGTFSRKVAGTHEDVEFWGPGNDFFDRIIHSAIYNHRGCCSAMEIDDAPSEAEGFFLTWNVSYNPLKLLKIDDDICQAEDMFQYLPGEPFEEYYDISGERHTELIPILRDLLADQGKKANHLGKRGDGSIIRFIHDHPDDDGDWAQRIEHIVDHSREQALNYFSKRINIDKVNRHLQEQKEAKAVQEQRYGKKIRHKDWDAINEALRWGLDNRIIRLDSIAYIHLKKGSSEQ